MKRENKSQSDKSSRDLEEANLNTNLIQQQIFEHLQNLQNNSTFYSFNPQHQQNHSPTSLTKSNFFHKT
jgi:hypothetical protein